MRDITIKVIGRTELLMHNSRLVNPMDPTTKELAAAHAEAGDFTLPAVWRSGPLMLTVSTSGASPALARALRDRAAEALGPAPAGASRRSRSCTP